MRIVLIDMLDRKLLTDIFGANLLLFDFSCFRNSTAIWECFFVFIQENIIFLVK